jgi:ribosomal protein L16/L10AE
MLEASAARRAVEMRAATLAKTDTERYQQPTVLRDLQKSDTQVEPVLSAKEKTGKRRNGRGMENKEKGINEVKVAEKLKEMNRVKEEAREAKKALEKARELKTIMEVEFMASDGECPETPDLDMIDQPEGHKDKEGRREASTGKGKNQMGAAKVPRKPNMMVLKPRCAMVHRRQDITTEIQPSQESLELEVFR